MSVSLARSDYELSRLGGADGNVRQGGEVLCYHASVHGARLVFTDRTGGVGLPPYDALNLALHTGDEEDRVQANRGLVAQAVRLTAGDLVFGQQVHGTGVRAVHASSEVPRGGAPDTDGLVTTARGVAVVMMGADCLPVLLAADGVVGAAHVGRAGLAGGVVREVLRVMRAEGAGAVAARIGPGVCGRCYEVPADMAVEVERLAPGSRATTRTGAPSIDLVAGVRRQLAAEGVDDVEHVEACTLEEADRFFSYRRDGVTGRQAGLAVLL
jgi:YfiH family protein